MADDPHPPSLRIVPISGNHVHAFHTIYATIYHMKKHNFRKMRGGVEGRLKFFRKFENFRAATLRY